MDISTASLLDIPAQLAFVFSKIDDWEPTNNERHLVSVNGVTLNSPNHSLPVDIDNFRLSDYALLLHCKDTLSAVSSVPLSEPIIYKHNDHDFKDSVTISKLLYRYLYDKTSSVRQRAIADFIVQYALTNDNLRDEILVQLCNLTFKVSWRETDEEYLHRAWSLVLHCLSAFKPTSSLHNYLLKYVSDHGYNGFNSLVQHKLLDGVSTSKRMYPPCLLEWRANQTLGAMALLATFADGYAQHGHVESFTTSEQFVHDLLSARQVKTGQFGWTVALHRDGYIYECADGCNYILDLVSEMDIVPSFPCCLSYLLVSNEEGSLQHRQSQRGNSSGASVEILRLEKLDIDELSEPVIPANQDDSDTPLLSTNSALNARYVIPSESATEDAVHGRHISTLESAGPEMDKWLENVFNHALGETADTFGENNLPGRLKGGGDKQTQAQQRTILNAPFSNQQSDGAAWSASSAPQYGFSQPFSINSATSTGLPQTMTFTGTSGNVISQPLNSDGANSTGLPQTLMLNGAAAGTFFTQPLSMTHSASVTVPPTLSPNGTSNTGGGVSLAINKVSSVVPSGLSPPLPTVYPQTFLPPAVGSVPLDQLQLSTAEQLLQQQIMQQQQWQLQRENINLQTQLENQQLRNELLRQQLQQQQQQQQQLLQPVQQLPQPVVRHSATVISVGDVTNPRPVSSGSVLIVPDTVPNNTHSERYRTMSAQNEHSASVRGSTSALNSSNPTSQMQSSSELSAVKRSSEYRTMNSDLARDITFVRDQFPVEVASKTETPQVIYIDNRPAATVKRVIPSPSPPASILTHGQPVADSRSVATVTLVIPPPLPPAQPAPPLPPTPQLSDSSKPAAVTNDVDVPVVRVGKIQWPPPRDDQERPAVQVGRFKIDEKTSDQSAKPKPSAENVRQKVNDRIIANAMDKQKSSTTEDRQHQLSNEAVVQAVEPTPVKDEPSEKPLSMRDRQKTLESQLTSQYKHNSVSAIPSVTALNDKRLSVENASTRQEHDIDLVTSAAEPTQKLDIQSTSAVLQSQDESENSDQHLHTLRHTEPKKLGDVQRMKFDLLSLEPINTIHHDCNYRMPAVTYDNSAWKLSVRKQVFSPLETLDDDLLIDLIYTQIVSDVFTGSIRIRTDDLNSIKSVLSDSGVNSTRIVTDQVSESFKLSVINTARSWPYYFSRLFVISGGRRHSEINLLAVSHNGLRLLARDLQSINVIQYFRFNEIQDVRVPNPKTLQIHAASTYFIFYTCKAHQICSFIKSLSMEAAKNARRVRAIEAFKAQDETQLSFNKGDVITVPSTAPDTKTGWLHGAVHGRTGFFPADVVVGVRLRRLAQSSNHLQLICISISIRYNYSRKDDIRFIIAAPVTSKSQAISTIRGSFLDANNKYTMLEFAMSHFRQTPQRSQQKYSAGDQSTDSMRPSGSDEWTWREHVNLVKWADTPIETSLTKLESQANNKKAVECFVDIMRYMDDAVMPEKTDAIGCTMKVLSTCRQNDELRDEIYCQVMKQTTNNRSTKSDSCQQGWRLLSLITSFYRCSDSLLPYLTMYIQQTAFDKRRANYMLAKLCLHNLQQTLKYGGRQTMPSSTELTAIILGKGPSQLVVSLPGGTPIRVAVNTSTVTCDVIDQICDKLDVAEPQERREFTLFVINKQNDDYYPVQLSAYTFDVITETRAVTSNFYLLVQRTTWLYPLHLVTGNQTYINIMYQQLRPVYIDGNLLQTPQNKLLKQSQEELVLLAALQIQAAEIKQSPQQKDIEMYVPKNALQLRDIKMSQWIQLITSQLSQIKELSRFECQIRFLETLSRWSMFGSTFFAIKRVTGLANRLLTEAETLLSVNKGGLHVCSSKTHEVVTTVMFKELLSVRHHNERAGGEFVDIKRVTADNQSTMIQLFSDEAESIAAVICQYVKLMNAATKSSTSSRQEL